MINENSAKIHKEPEDCGFSRELLLRIAHDLRSPLTNIKGFADALLDGSIPEEKSELSLMLISLEAERLSKLASRLCAENEAPVIKTFGICEMIRRIYLSLSPKLDSKKIKTDFAFSDDDEFYVSADEGMIYEVIFNLADNAAKYTENGGSITFSANASEKYVEISVTNSTNTPLSDGDKEKLFEKKHRRASESSSNGFGLGLYIVKKLLSYHGKEISAVCCESGITFGFFLDKAE